MLLCMGVDGPPAWAIKINGEEPDTGIYDRFAVGSYPGAPVANPTFIGTALGFDLSGIGWEAAVPARSITLVSPQYFVGAWHNLPGVGATLQFVGNDHLLHLATVASYQRLTYTGTDGPQGSDLGVGRLTLALPSSVTPMPIFYGGVTDILNPSSFDAYDGLSLYNYGWTARMGTNVLDSIEEFTFGGPQTNIGLVYSQGAGAGETLLEAGDSGSPTLAYRDGVYGLIGTHSGIDGVLPISYDAFVSYTSYVNQMNAILAADGQSLILVVPEPGTIFFGVALLGICGAHRIRRRRQEV
jgi:hypothetical protein